MHFSTTCLARYGSTATAFAVLAVAPALLPVQGQTQTQAQSQAQAQSQTQAQTQKQTQTQAQTDAQKPRSAQTKTSTPPAAPDASRISAVQLYPGSALIERTQAVKPGAQQAQFACLPGGLDVAQLQAQGSDGVQVGEIAVHQQSRKLLGKTCQDELQTRIDKLQQQLAQQQADIDAIDYATGFLQSFGRATPDGDTLAPEQIGAAAQALHTQARELLGERQQLVQQHEATEEQLAQLLAQDERRGGADAMLSVVRVTLLAPMGGQVALRYQVAGPSWQPAYRAQLDTDAGQLRLVRLAQVVQDTGEDWSDVALTLATGQPTAPTQGPLPSPWRIAINDRSDAEGMARLQKAPALVMAEAASVAQDSGATLRSFAPEVAQGTFATEFKLPQPVSVPAGGDAITLTLEEQTLPAHWLVRTAPAFDTSAYVVAVPDETPPGAWPAGAVSLYRDASLVGQGHFDLQQIARDGLTFGRDELIRVQLERPEHTRGTKGLIGSRNQRVDERVYRIENGHDRAVEVQVLDAAPIAQDEKIKIDSSYAPAVQGSDWHERRGTVYWEQELAAGAAQQFSATHTITWPKDEALREWHR